MVEQLSIRCSCGSMRGIANNLSPQTGTHLICMCDDCQAYAHYLGKADEILDANGGTEVFQVAPAQLTLTEGQEHLRCLRLTKKGLYRWYAGCCKTPFANTVGSAKMPFAGVFIRFFDFDHDANKQERVFGPIRARIQARFGTGTMPPDAHQRAPFGLIWRSIKLLYSGWRQGLHTPSPFFVHPSGEPVVDPYVLTPEERNSLRIS
jgi:hypothetical protein